MIISKHFKDFNCFVPCRRNYLDGKKPIGINGDWNNHLISFQKACEWVANGGNIGLCMRYGLLAIDCDSVLLFEAVKNQLPQTYLEKSASGGYHFIFKFEGQAENRNINFNGEHLGEVRANRQYIVIAPSVAKSKIDGKFKAYEILQDIESALLTSEQLQAFLNKFPKDKIANKSPKTTGVGVVDRSRFDFAKCCELIEHGYTTFSEVAAQMLTLGSTKWQQREEKYRRDTFEAALRKVRK